MSPEENQLLTQLFDRVRQASTTARDSDAETYIETELKSQPYAPYYLAQAVIMQEKGLEAANTRIQQLEAEVKDLQEHASASPASQQQGGFLGGLSALFGGSPGPTPAAPANQSGPWSRNAPVPTQPQPQAQWAQPQAPAAGPWGQSQPSGGGFLSGALNTAAGVAGGMLMADAVRSLISPHLGGGGLFGGSGGMFGGSSLAGQPVVEETVVNNTYNVDNNNSGNTNTPDTSTPDDNTQMADYDDGSNDYDDGGFDDSMNA